MALVHLHHSSGVERSSSPYQWVITWATEGVSEPESLRGGTGLLASLLPTGAGERDGPGLHFVSNKWVLNFISPFD